MPETTPPGGGRKYQPRHMLSDLDTEKRTAVCSICGPVRVKRRTPTAAGGPNRYRCMVSYRATPSEVRSVKAKRLRKGYPDWEKLGEKPRTAESRRKKLLAKYGMSVREFDEMSAAQDHRCAICRKNRRLVIDHDHQSGRVRGLLCVSCNAALGVFGDSPQGLTVASQYLR